MRCKNIKETLVKYIIVIVAVNFYIFFRMMIVRGSTITARSRKPRQNTALAVILEVTMTIPG